MSARYLIGLVALAAGAPSLAAAQDIQGPPADTAAMADDMGGDMGGDTVTIGIGAAYMSDYEGSNDYKILPVPAAIGTIGGIAFTVLGTRASADLIPSPAGPSWDVQLGPVAAVNFIRSNRQGIDDPQVRLLGERGTAIELGGYAGIGKTGVITSAYDKLSVSVSYRHDVSDVHDSGIWQPTVNYFTPLSRKAGVGVFATAERVGTNYVRTYYDISPAASARTGLPVYSGRGGWKTWSVGAVGGYALTGDLLHGFKLVGGGTYRRMINAVGNSPLVRIAGSRDQWLAVAGIAYTF